MQDNTYEKALLAKFIEGDQSAFSVLFNRYYKDLTIFASSYTGDVHSAEEIVQGIFVKLWENRGGLNITSSLRSYLLKSVQNRCLDWLRHKKVKSNYSQAILNEPEVFENDTENYLLYSDLSSQIAEALESMPEELATAFRMNRFEGLTYSEIAERQGVSVRTIEVRIGKTLEMLREQLREYLMPLLALLLSFLNP